MSLEVFLMLLFVISLFTGLFAEGIKICLQERQKSYYANAVAGYASVVVSLLVGGGYVILAEIAFNAKIAVCLIALMFLSWLAAMVGYDKVMQTIAQIKGK